MLLPAKQVPYYVRSLQGLNLGPLWAALGYMVEEAEFAHGRLVGPIWADTLESPYSIWFITTSNYYSVPQLGSVLAN